MIKGRNSCKGCVHYDDPKACYSNWVLKSNDPKTDCYQEGEIISRDPKASYYDVGGIATQDYLKAKASGPMEYISYLHLQALRYGSRLWVKHDNPLRDAEKMLKHVKWLVDELKDIYETEEDQHE